MVEKNPYENGVDIPDFVESKDEDVDLSVFKMSDDELNTSTNKIDLGPVSSNTTDSMDDDFDDEDDEPKRKLSPKGVVVIGGVALVVLLILAVVGFVYGAKQHSAYVAAASQVADLQTQVETLTNENATLIIENEELKAAQVETTTTTETGDGTTYTVNNGMNVRKGPGTSYDYASASSVSNVDGAITNDNAVMLTAGTSVVVYETSTDGSGNTWGRIGTDAWICLIYNGEAFATAE